LVVNPRVWRLPTTWVAAGLWLFILGIAAAIVAMKSAGWQGAGNTSDTSGVALFLALFAFSTMGALVAAHVPRNAIGWIFLAIPLGGAIAGITENLAFQGLVHNPGSIPGATAFAWVYSWAWYPLIGLIGFVLLLYPTGAAPGPRWRVIAWALAVVLAVMTLGYMFYPGPLPRPAGQGHPAARQPARNRCAQGRVRPERPVRVDLHGGAGPGRGRLHDRALPPLRSASRSSSTASTTSTGSSTGRWSTARRRRYSVGRISAS
jgi:hypothetical protein